MLWIGSANKSAEGDSQFLPGFSKLRGDMVGELFGRCARLLGRLLNFRAVLVGAGEKIYILAAQAVVAGEHIGGNGSIGVAYMRRIVDIINWRGYVVFFHFIKKWLYAHFIQYGMGKLVGAEYLYLFVGHFHSDLFLEAVERHHGALSGRGMDFTADFGHFLF